MVKASGQLERKIWWHHWSFVFLLAAIAVFIIWFLLRISPWLRDFQERNALTASQQETEKQRLEDKYGGKTKEETINLLVSALEGGNVYLASRYFVIEKKEAWFKVLSVYQDKGLLVNFIRETKSRATDSMAFEFYPSGVWKIKDI
ncbi:MAG: hypothetical protein HY506_02480 [Candidatus Yanofskybacteria bacterium]|nr:hypothetical protein [Candidatus Yanofskybacteria bacterium]